MESTPSKIFNTISTNQCRIFVSHKVFCDVQKVLEKRLWPPPQTRLGEITTLPRPPSRRERERERERGTPLPNSHPIDALCVSISAPSAFISVKLLRRTDRQTDVVKQYCALDADARLKQMWFLGHVCFNVCFFGNK